MRIVTRIVLWAVIAFLSWKLIKSINDYVEFNKIKEARYAKVIENLKDIQAAEIAYQTLNGKFTDSYDTLIRFIETGQYAITTSRDTSFPDRERNKAFGLDPEEGGYYLEVTIIDTIGFKTVKDSLFRGSDRYKRMMNIPLTDIDVQEKIELRAGVIERKGSNYSVFEARVAKDIILKDQDPNLVVQEKNTVSVEGVNGAYIKVGDMEDINTSGNWPTLYDSNKRDK